TGRIEPNYPKVCGHQGNVLDIKWNPFIENIIASCSEDTSVRIWEIPEGGLKRNMTEAVLELYGHSRRVGLVEWHPTTNNILFSAGYDYKVSLPGNAIPKGFPGSWHRWESPVDGQSGIVERWNGSSGLEGA
ncbi:hypothetical protein EK904_001765, partial [Melospiza melodia maxima]